LPGRTGVPACPEKAAITVDDSAKIATSFPKFEILIGDLGAVFEPGV